MKILLINAVYKTASTGRSIAQQEEYYNSIGNQVFIAASIIEKSETHFPIGTSNDHKIHGLLSRITGKQAYFSKSATKRLIKWIETVKPDVIQINNVHSNYLNFPGLLKYIAKNDIPTVLVLDDCWHYTGKCCHYTTQGCYRWQSGCGKCPQLNNWNKSWLFDRTKKILNDKQKLFSKISRLGVIGVSDWIISEAKKSVLKNAKMIQRIYNWVDLDTFKPTIKRDDLKEKLNLAGKFIILGVAMKMDESKGLSSFDKLADSLDDNFQIVLVGNCDTNKHHPKIKYIERTNSVSELSDFYSIADVLIQFSEEESFGKVCAEALSCGTPIIVSNSTASPELVGENCGYVIPPKNVQQAINSITEIQQKTKEFYTPNCIAFANKYFSAKKNMDEYLDFYRNLKGRAERKNDHLFD
ncbi:MAG: glycosyltransferase [Bacillota bacterium]|nr:glycosyltransferase [Bacillota bacterium]